MPKRSSTTRRAVENIIRLRRAGRQVDAETQRDIEPVLSYLEDLVGPTVSRAETARLLRISHTALDRWIRKGDIAAVMTPSGRQEIPLAQVVDLLEGLEENAGDRQLALATVIRERRREAAAIPEDEFLPPRRRAPEDSQGS
jgi:hypothetical protein